MTNWNSLSTMKKWEFGAKIIRWPLGLITGIQFVSTTMNAFKSSMAEWIFVVIGFIWIIAGIFVDWRDAFSIVMTDEEQKAALRFPIEVILEILICMVAFMFIGNVALESTWFSVSTIWRIMIGIVSFVVIWGAYFRAMLKMKGKELIKK